MPPMTFITLVYVGILSMIAVVMTVWDKVIAGSGRRRVPERTLLWVGALGGAAAMLITMKCIRHKTLKPKFMVGLPLIIILHIALIALVWLWQNGMLTML